MKQTFIIDGHVHIYPQFDIKSALLYSKRNFAKILPPSTLAAAEFWLLTERSDCHFFDECVKAKVAGFHFEPTDEDTIIAVRDAASNKVLHIAAGRQLISSERLEICALLTRYNAEDKVLSAAELVRAVNDSGGVAAVNWAPGKWFGERGRVVQKLFESFSPDQLFISDTTMRPRLWATPKLMAAAKRQGFRVICGSDPLPFAGEEKVIATYAGLVDGEFDQKAPATSLKQAFKSADGIKPLGRRSGLVTFIKRQTKIMLDKR